MKKIFDRIRLKSGFAKLRDELRKRKDEHHSVALSEARSIGLLFPINTEKEYNEVQDFARQLESEQGNGKIKLLGFIFNSELKEKLKGNIELISAEDIEWNYIPEKSKIKNFLSNEFDILINLCTELCFPLVYIAAISKSAFKIAAYDTKQEQFFDLLIDTHQNSIRGFSEEIKHYLDKIR